MICIGRMCISCSVGLTGGETGKSKLFPRDHSSRKHIKRSNSKLGHLVIVS